MGDVYWGLHLPLAARLARRLKLSAAIETGTYFAVGSVQLAAIFDNVWTIESDLNLFGFVSQEYKNISQLNFLHGESPRVLADLLPTVEEPVLFILDAHWFPTSGLPEVIGRSQCPLMDELNVILECFAKLPESAIIIDDADMFLDALGRRFREKDFPPILTIVEKLRKMFPTGVVEIIDDVIVAGPLCAMEEILEYRHLKYKVGSPRS